MVSSRVKQTDFILLVALVALAALMTFLFRLHAPPERVGGPLGQPSSFFNRSYGTKALFLTLQRLGFQVTRLRRPIGQNTLEDIDSLVMLKPVVGLNVDEIRSLEEWLRDGGKLFAVPSPDRGICEDATGCEEIGWFQIGNAETADDDSWRTPHSLQIPSNATNSLLLSIRALAIRERFWFESLPAKIFSQDTPIPEAFITDGQKNYGIRLTFGDGEVIALSDSYPLTNLGITNEDNSSFVANLGRILGGSSGEFRIAFDEFHLGFPERSSSPSAIVRMILAGHWGTGIVQSLITGIVALVVSSIRFGKPQTGHETQIQLQSDFSTAAGALLRKANGNRIVYKTLLEDYRTRVATRFGSLAVIGTDKFLALVKRRTGIEPSGVFPSPNSLDNTQNIDDTQLLQMALGMETVLEELESEHGNRSRT